MVQSIIDDIKSQFSYGNKITQIILINLFVLLLIKIVFAFSPPETGIYKAFIQNLALSSEGWTIVKKPWTLFTHMILHEGLWHFGWNMLIFYWFGRIVGDLAGDRRIAGLYILGGLSGALFYIIYAQLSAITGIALGASGAVMCFVVAAGFLAPEYNMRLLLIGDVRLKYVALALVLIDLVLLAENSNPGGRFAHLGGAIMGGVFVHMLRQGLDLTSPFQRGSSLISASKPKKRRIPMTVIHNKKRPNRASQDTERPIDTQERIDQILDKINASGYESLTAEEKDFLYQASKNS